jgi:V/A-type H+-transporting ATPase subunit D
MAKIKHTKNELRAQKEALSRYERFLPMLQLKKQQLQAEVQNIDAQIDASDAELSQAHAELQSWVKLFSSGELPEELVVLDAVETAVGNIAGVSIPVLKDLRISRLDNDLFESPPWLDEAGDMVEKLIRIRVARDILAEQKERVAEELRVTTQRVNLFEKIKIPECRDNIRVIRIFLGDEQTAAVARGKLAKRRTQINQAEDSAA